MDISQQTIDTVKGTVPALKEHGIEIVTLFYDTLFKRYPDLRPQFNLDRQPKGAATSGTPASNGVPAQVNALANAVLTYASNIDDVSKMLPAIERICHRHVAHAVRPVQYEAVGECMLYAIEVVLKQNATPQVLAAWTDAFQFLAQTFIECENNVRARLAASAGFEGFVNMRVVSNQDEENSVGKIKYRLLGVVPEDHAVPPVARGQFVAVNLTLLDGQVTTSSLNLVPSGPSDRLTIRVPHADSERASEVLHNLSIGDTVRVSMPCGKPIRLNS